MTPPKLFLLQSYMRGTIAAILGGGAFAQAFIGWGSAENEVASSRDVGKPF